MQPRRPLLAIIPTRTSNSGSLSLILADHPRDFTRLASPPMTQRPQLLVVRKIPAAAPTQAILAGGGGGGHLLRYMLWAVASLLVSWRRTSP